MEGVRVNENTADLTGLAVALGRVEEKLTGMAEKENKTADRLDRLESRLSSIEVNLAANVRPRAPWYVIVGGIGGILVIGLNGFAFFQLLAAVAP